jgi:CubicO group peptidase (beta-lactamase class C family)
MPLRKGMSEMSENHALRRSSPESQGLPSAAVCQLLDYFQDKNLEVHSIMILRHGNVVAEGWWDPYSADRPHMLFSLSKSFTSTAIGFAVQEGLLTVDDALCDFFPGELPKQVSPNLAKMKVYHLLTMSTGHAEDPSERVFSTPDGHWVRAFLALDVEREPGSLFVYNTAATYMLSAILQKLTGQTLLDYLTPRLFDPLGIVGATWETCPRGISTGGFGLNIKTEDIAKFGQLYLQQGAWNGQQLLSPEWIDEATRKHIDNDNVAVEWRQGYGYQFWRCRHNAYRGDGAFGQFCIVLPEKDLVVAITSGTNDMQGVMDGIWEIILPALAGEALPESKTEHERLLVRLSSLALPLLPAQKGANPERFAGRYVFPQNNLGQKAAAFSFEPDSCCLTLETTAGETEISCGYGRYEQGRFPLDRGSALAYSCASWKSESTLEVMCRLVETPFTYTLICDFSPGQVEISVKANCGFGSTEFPSIVGKLDQR